MCLCVWFCYRLAEGTINSLSNSRLRLDTLELFAARSINCSPICSYKFWMSLVMEWFSGVPLDELELPLMELSRVHRVGNTCSSTCFCLREYTCGIRSIKGDEKKKDGKTQFLITNMIINSLLFVEIYRLIYKLVEVSLWHCRAELCSWMVRLKNRHLK